MFIFQWLHATIILRDFWNCYLQSCPWEFICKQAIQSKYKRLIKILLGIIIWNSAFTYNTINWYVIIYFNIFHILENVKKLNYLHLCGLKKVSVPAMILF